MIKKAHCLFEQSGTFKNEFIKLGIPAEDYDIRNDFGETDHVVDLFREIKMGGAGEASIFDGFQKDELIVAFFPCTRFEDQIVLYMRGDAVGQKNWTDAEKLRYAMRLQSEVNEMYHLISQLALICVERGLRLIIENPAGGSHYLTRYWPIKPKWIDHDRTERGDSRKKPTQYWFINFDPRHNFVLEPLLLQTKIKTHNKTHSQVERSIIMPQYARRFIQEFILEDPN